MVLKLFDIDNLSCRKVHLKNTNHKNFWAALKEK